jgi:hypothetical protein
MTKTPSGDKTGARRGFLKLGRAAAAGRPGGR